ncbi:MAG: immune inhibitor A, partial [Deltaproteobacteria bacterium]|nr:immune inhibitor A [Deltaproteobacteria bacterium]
CWGCDLSTQGWHEITANLSAFVGGQVILRMSMETDGSVQRPGVYIDDLKVTEASEIPITITSTSPLADAYVGYAYSNYVQRTGGSSGAVWTITGGTNIGWLSINAATGELYGSPQGGDLGPVSVDVHVEEGSVPTNFDDVTLTFNVAQALYFEDFEGTCPNGWTLGGDWQCGTPTVVGPSNAFSGAQCLATQLAANYNINQAWATTTASSPAINLAGTTTPQLSFYMWIATEGYTYDGANLKISTDGGQSYALYATPQPAYTLTIDNQSAWGEDQSTQGWQLVTADLTSYAGQSINVQVGFHTDGSVAYPGVYIDDMLVSD